MGSCLSRSACAGSCLVSVWQPATATRLLARGSVWSAAATLFGLGAGIATTIVLVRAMSTSAYGSLAVGTAVASFFIAIGSLGLGPTIARFGTSAPSTTRATSQAVARVALPISVAAGLVLTGLGAAVGGAMQLSSRLAGAGLVVFVLLPLIAVAPIQAILNGYLTATFRPRLVSAQPSLASAVQLGLAAVAAATAFVAAYQVALTRLAAGVLSLGAMLLWLQQREPREGVDVAVPSPQRIMRFGLAMTVTATSGILISQLDIFVLGVARDSADVGRYAPVSRLADIAMALPIGVGAYLLPALTSAVAADDIPSLRRLYHWSSRWAVVVSVPLIALLAIAPRELFEVLFGTGLRSAVLPARILAAGVGANFLFGFNGIALDAFGQARAAAVRSGVGIALSAALCPILIPFTGATGAAIATSVPIVAINVACSVMLLRRYGIKPWNRHVAAVVATAIASIVVVTLLIQTQHLHRWAALIIAVVPAIPSAAVARLGTGRRP
jgi:O-antigen/teichoic acid export membrane protein